MGIIRYKHSWVDDMKPSQFVVENLFQKIVSQMNYEDLPSEWNSFDLSSFSDTINLWDFQQTALKNAIKCLYLYFQECNGSKELFYEKYINPYIDPQKSGKFDLDLSKFNIQYLDLIHNFYQLKDQPLKI